MVSNAFTRELPSVFSKKVCLFLSRFRMSTRSCAGRGLIADSYRWEWRKATTARRTRSLGVACKASLNWLHVGCKGKTLPTLRFRNGLSSGRHRSATSTLPGTRLAPSLRLASSTWWTRTMLGQTFKPPSLPLKTLRRRRGAGRPDPAPQARSQNSNKHDESFWKLSICFLR